MDGEKIIYKPKNDPRQVVWLCVVLFLAGAALMIAGALLGQFRWVFQVSAVILFVAGIQLTARYILSGFIYVLDAGSFMVYRVSGNSRRELCGIYLDSCYALVRAPVQKELEKLHGRFDLVYNHMARLSPPAGEKYAFLFRFNGKNSVIYFDSDREFASKMAILAGIEID